MRSKGVQAIIYFVTAWSTVKYQKLMSDMCHIGVRTYEKYLHSHLIQDEANCYVKVFLLKAKGEATTVLLSYVTWITAQGHHVSV